MQLTSLLVTFLATAATAAPATSKRACAVKYPQGVTNVHLAKNPAVNIPQTLTFSIPAGAVGPCSLVAQFQQNYAIAMSGSAQVNFYDVNGPATGALVGSYTFATNPWGPTYATINSWACRASMTYRLEIAGTKKTKNNPKNNNDGLIMTYNC